MRKSVVQIQAEPAAPPKPAFGAPCNGCGLCCLAWLARRWIAAGRGCDADFAVQRTAEAAASADAGS